MHKFGQIVTINKKVYRITKNDYLLVCKKCDCYTKTECKGPDKCLKYMPKNSVLKLIKQIP